jgi:hypothetical protein
MSKLKAVEDKPVSKPLTNKDRVNNLTQNLASMQSNLSVYQQKAVECNEHILKMQGALAMLEELEKEKDGESS